MSKGAKKQTEKIKAAVANADWDAPQSLDDLRMGARVALAQWELSKAESDRISAREFLRLLVKLGAMAEITLLRRSEGAAP